MTTMYMDATKFSSEKQFVHFKRFAVRADIHTLLRYPWSLSDKSTRKIFYRLTPLYVVYTWISYF